MHDVDTTPRSHLYLLHICTSPDASPDAEEEWHGQILHLASGEVRFFQGKEALQRCLCETVASFVLSTQKRSIHGQ